MRSICSSTSARIAASSRSTPAAPATPAKCFPSNRSPRIRPPLQPRRRDGRWRIFSCGLGVTAAELDLHVYHDDTFSSVLTVNASAQNNFGHLVALQRVERISIRTLDEILAELEIGPARRIFLKTDTQGYDAAVLAGATDTLRQTLAVLTEATVAPLYDGSSRLEEINALLLPLGFARAGLFPIGYAPETHTLIELDCFFCRPASHISPPQ